MTWTKTAPVITISTLVLSLMAAGCGQRSTSRAALARICELEAQSARLEDDCKAAKSARDQARARVESLEKVRGQLLKQLEQLDRVTKDRDDLKVIVAQRTSERDSMQNYLTQFSRDLQNLATKIEQAANPTPTGVPVIVTSRQK